MTDYASRLDQLRERFRKRLADDLQQIEKIAAGQMSDAQLMCLTELAHKLAGTSGSVGFADIGEAASALDREWTSSSSDLTELRRNVQKLVDASKKHLPSN